MMKLDAGCPDISVVLARVAYNPETGDFIAKVQRGRRRAGDKLGYADALGYIKLCFDGRWVMAHRLAWRLIHGGWPAGEIDHINGNPSDNRIVNLRVATRSQNVMNTRRGNGVCYRPDRGKYQVSIMANGRNHFIGMFKDKGAAERAGAAAKVRLHGEFANVAPVAQPQQEILL